MTKEEYLRKAKASIGWRYILLYNDKGGVDIHECYSGKGGLSWTAHPTGISYTDGNALDQLEIALSHGIIFTEEELES